MALHFSDQRDLDTPYESAEDTHYVPDFEGDGEDDAEFVLPAEVLDSLIKQTTLYGTYFKQLLAQGFDREEAMFLLVTMIHGLNESSVG